jgi:uncharacterized protein YqhQ
MEAKDSRQKSEGGTVNPRHHRIGGQAVIEGVMMRAPGAVATAVRHPSGEVVVRRDLYRSPAESFKLLKLPILRGAVVLIESLILGMKALVFSAEVASDEKNESIGPSSEKRPRTFSWEILGAVALALVLGLGLFFYLPLMATEWLGVKGSVMFNVVDGIFRVAVFLLYLWIISRWKEMRRVFEYHGAEHKVIFTFESGNEVTVANARGFTTHHPRCGTSFLLVVMLVSVVVFVFLGKPHSVPQRLLRLAFVPLIAGISYEVIRLSERAHPALQRVIAGPGLLLQRWTTREPSDDQLEVALRAFDEARRGEGATARECEPATRP